MKKKNYIYVALATALFVGSCKQELIVKQDPTVTAPATPSKGSASFTKFVAVGNSYVAGMQASALFNTSQENSLPRIMAKQFESVEGPATFNQPDINSVNGFNPINSVLPGLVLGRLFLFDPDGTGPRSAGPAAAKTPQVVATCPASVTTPAAPAPFNTADFPAAFAGSKTTLQNYGVPLIYLAQALTAATSGPPPPAPNPAYSPFFSRFAVTPSPDGTNGSSILIDAKAAAGTFYLIWLGFDDVLLYAATGADGVSAGTYPMTAAATFQGQFNALINGPSAPSGLMTGTTFKGVVGNIPDFTTLPYFYTVTWNNITLDAATATSLNSNLAANYNGFLDAMVTNTIITAAERDKRRLNFVAGKNGILLSDDVGFSTGGLTDLTPYMTGPAAGLVPFALARQATATDLVPLAAGSFLGTCFGGSPTAINGVSYPVPDKYILTPAETGAILTRTAEFNASITAAVATTGGRLVIADVRTAYNNFVAAKAFISDNVMITPSFAPPTGAFSEDGLHPNSRGYAFTANIFIDAINAGFGAVIPKASLAAYSGTALPVSPL
ncbi:MAG: hypothetical protein HOP08_16710 [Cyclobacteriaceae bacterium]|nr:hypothetical protein [Cyclobacteriaceae bacterium]